MNLRINENTIFPQTCIHELKEYTAYYLKILTVFHKYNVHPDHSNPNLSKQHHHLPNPISYSYVWQPTSYLLMVFLFPRLWNLSVEYQSLANAIDPQMLGHSLQWRSLLFFHLYDLYMIYIRFKFNAYLRKTPL